VVRACLYDPDLAEVYESFARHWGFVALPSRPRHPQEQGVQERSGGYVKHNALKGRRFESLEEVNEFLRRWNRQIAQQRIHGSTRRQVLAHFLEVERPALQPLAEERFALFEVGTRAVHPDGYIEVEGGFYTAPHHLVGQRVRVRWDERLLRIYHRGEVVRVHIKTVDAGQLHDRPGGPAGPQAGSPGGLPGGAAGPRRTGRRQRPGLGPGRHRGARRALLPTSPGHALAHSPPPPRARR